MKRRSFLSLAGAAVAAPLLPTAANATAAVGYNRYMYGLALFHARTRASISVVDIATKLRVNAATAEAMISEMARRGAVTSSASAGTMRAVNMHTAPRPKGALLKKVVQSLTDDTLPNEELAETCAFPDPDDQPQADETTT